MAVILQVNFTPGAAQAGQTSEQRLKRAHELASQAGLVWKVWISDEATNTRGGIYLFESVALAKAWGDDILRGNLQAGGASDISIRYFEVNEAASLITHATLHRAVPAANAA